LAISSDTPIIIIGITAAAKMAVRPNIEYQAAIVLKVSAVSNTRLDNVNTLDMEIFIQ
jgi:hypothetical protein